MAITLKRSGNKLETGNDCRRNWTISITAEADDGMDPNIFVYHAVDNDENGVGDKFSNIASLQDINVVPVYDPTSTNDEPWQDHIPYYRTNTVTFDCYNLLEMRHIWLFAKVQVKKLVEEYKASRKLKEQEEVTFQ